MPPVRPNIDARYREYVALRLRLNAHLSAERVDDAACEQVENELIEQWDELGETQRISLHGVGADLSWVLARGAPPPRGRNREEVTREEQAALNEAYSVRDWHAVLYCLRVCAPLLTVESLIYYRALCYGAIGLGSVAAVFHEFAADLARAPLRHRRGAD